MSAISASIDCPVKGFDSITIMGDVHSGGGTSFMIEGGGCGLSQDRAEQIAKAILRCIKLTRSAHFKLHGRKAP